MTFQQREQFWGQILAEWQASGLSGMAFCQQFKHPYHQFTYWRSKLGVTQTESPAYPTGFARVVSNPSCSASTELTLTLPSGISITGLHASNVELLGSILRQL